MVVPWGQGSTKLSVQHVKESKRSFSSSRMWLNNAAASMVKEDQDLSQAGIWTWEFHVVLIGRHEKMQEWVVVDSYLVVSESDWSKAEFQMGVLVWRALRGQQALRDINPWRGGRSLACGRGSKVVEMPEFEDIWQGLYTESGISPREKSMMKTENLEGKSHLSSFTLDMELEDFVYPVGLQVFFGKIFPLYTSILFLMFWLHV